MSASTVCIAGVALLEVRKHVDARGELGVFESGTALGFNINRVFYIKAGSVNIVRAEHSGSHVQALCALTGSVIADLDNGDQQQSVFLSGEEILRIAPGVWLRLRAFAPNTVVLAMSSERFADMVQFPTPRPELIRR